MASIIIFLEANSANSRCWCSQTEQREMKGKGFSIPDISIREKSQHTLFSLKFSQLTLQDTKEHYSTQENLSPAQENLLPR